MRASAGFRIRRWGLGIIIGDAVFPFTLTLLVGPFYLCVWVLR